MSYFSPDERVSGATDVAVRHPKMYRVLMHNDDYTTMEFVMEMLVRVFSKTMIEAEEITLAIHQKGLAVCGVYTEEIAETKVMQVHDNARKVGFPLRCSMEEDS